MKMVRLALYIICGIHSLRSGHWSGKSPRERISSIHYRQEDNVFDKAIGDSLAVGNIMTISLEDCIGRAEPQTT